MKPKNFIRHTKPNGEKQVAQTISDIIKQIHYLESIGGDKNEIQYWRERMACLLQRSHHDDKKPK